MAAAPLIGPTDALNCRRSARSRASVDSRIQTDSQARLHSTANQQNSKKLDPHVDVAACGSRVRTYLVRIVYDGLREFRLHTRQADVEAGTEEVGAVRQIEVQVYLGI